MSFEIQEYKASTPCKVKPNIDDLLNYYHFVDAIVTIEDGLGVKVKVPLRSIEVSTSALDFPEVTIEGYGNINIEFPEGVEPNGIK